MERIQQRQRQNFRIQTIIAFNAMSREPQKLLAAFESSGNFSDLNDTEIDHSGVKKLKTLLSGQKNSRMKVN